MKLSNFKITDVKQYRLLAYNKHYCFRNYNGFDNVFLKSSNGFIFYTLQANENKDFYFLNDSGNVDIILESVFDIDLDVEVSGWG